MQFSEQWLRTLVNPQLTTAELTHKLTMAGLEVEECRPVAPGFSGVVVGQVLECGKHPNADRLSLCSVDAGTGTPLSIVCGAPNVRAGMKIPVARIGALLKGESPDKPFEIKLAKMRGVESQGMLCSARELGLSEDHSGLLELPADAPVGRDFRDYFALDDAVITIKLTPNRADCLSVLGVAREVSALTGANLTAPVVAPVPAAEKGSVPVRISDPKGCGRFTGRVIRGVNAAAPTPDWMKQRLERAGQRSISALVDITNYVMLELGRPLHVYDLDRLTGGIDVRFGRKGEQLKLLNEQTVDVDESVLCITDGSGPIGLAGIMGGDSTKAGDGTRNVFLESAFFFPEAIAGRARRFNFTSDASHRFERGVDFQNNADGIERATALVLEICGGKPCETVDQVAVLPARAPVRMRAARARKVIGVDIATAEMAGIFARLGLPCTADNRDGEEAFLVTPPSFRFDITIEEDLIEEIARVHGFERIPAKPPVAPAVMHSRPEAARDAHSLRERLAACGYQEVVNFSFVDAAWETDFAGNANPIRLLNPIASQMSVMRSTLWGGLVANLRYNLNRKHERVRVFEVGRVFARDAAAADGPLSVAGINQPVRIGGLAYGAAEPEQWGEALRKVDFFDAKGDLESMLLPLKAEFLAATHPALHPGRSAKVIVGGREAGWIGELHPALQQKYELPSPAVVFEVDVAAVSTIGVARHREVSKFPPVVRDLAVVVDESVTSARLLEEMRAHGPQVVSAVRLFDVYRGKGVAPGQKSLAFRVVMQDTSKTLTDQEADSAMAQLTEILASRCSAKLRT